MIYWITNVLAFAVPALELYLLIARRGRAPVKAGDEGTLRAVWMLIGGGCLAGFLVAANTPSLRWPGTVGIVLLADGLLLTGLTLRIWAVVHLGKFFTVDVGIQRAHRVVQDGPYRFVRHPSYSGSLLALVGLGCLTFNWLGFLLIVGCSLAAYRLRIGVEEKVLLLNMGDDYRRYAARTKRLIPGIF